MSDIDKQGEPSEEGSSPSLSLKDLQKVAEMTAQLVAANEAEEASKAVDPSQRPDFDSATPDESTQKLKKGLIPGGFVNAPEGREFQAKAFSINRFPRDMDAKDFSMARYCMASERAMNTREGSLAFSKWAPKESAYYEALAEYGKEFKAAGEMVSGQDGGFLAPEIWTNTFYDINGVAV